MRGVIVVALIFYISFTMVSGNSRYEVALALILLKIEFDNDTYERTIVSESIPLRATLGIECQDVVVDKSIRSAPSSNLVREWVPAITGIARLVEGPVKRNPYTGDDFSRRDCDHGGC